MDTLTQNTKTAYMHWLERETKKDRDKMALIMYHNLMDAPGVDNQIWDILKQTGDEHYDFKSFFKAADYILTLK